MKLLVSLSFFLKIRILCTLVKGFLKFHHSCSSKFGWKNDVTSLNEHDITNQKVLCMMRMTRFISTNFLSMNFEHTSIILSNFYFENKKKNLNRSLLFPIRIIFLQMKKNQYIGQSSINTEMRWYLFTFLPSSHVCHKVGRIRQY